jgi:hypothetical protein
MNGVQYRVAEGVLSGVHVPSGVQLRCVSPASESVGPAFALRQSPKMALGPTLRGLKRAAEANKFQRIAGRLAALARAGQETTVNGAARCGLGRRVHTALFEYP